MASEPTSLAERRRRRGFTAAAVRFDDLSDSGELARQLKRHDDRAAQAWGYYDEIGEVHYAVNVSADQLARCPLYVAARPDPNSPLVPADDPDSGINSSLAKAANEYLATLRAPIGGQAQIVRQFDTNKRVAGEMYLLHYTGEKEAAIGWHIRSSQDIKVESDGTFKSAGLGTFAPSEVSRIWQPHPRKFEAADSGMFAVLGQCEAVLLADHHFRAALRSRLFAGLLLLSNGFRQGTEPSSVESAGDGEAQLDPVIADMLTALSTGIQEHGGASANTPNTLWGALEDVKDGARLLEFAQQVDPNMMALRESSLRRIAQGLDIPPEVVLGIADLNHWSAWAVGEQAVEHVKPAAAFMADAFTQVFLRPGLLELLDVSPAEVDMLEVAVDLSVLEKRPNHDEDAKYAYDKGELTGAGLRRALQLPESDGPEDSDVERWLVLNKAQFGQSLTNALLQRTVSPDLPTLSQDPQQDGPGAPVGEAPTNQEGPPIPAAADTSPPSRNRLSAIDIALTERLFAASLAAFRGALEGAGHKAKRNVKATHRAAVEHVAASAIVATLGPTILAAAGLDEDALLAGALGALRSDFDRWVLAAQTDALDAAIAMAGADPDEDQVAEFIAAQAQDREDAWEWFEGAATALLAERMVSGRGLDDWEVRGLVRRALARAGGADELAPFEPGEVPADGYGTGMATGPLILGALAGFGLGVISWEWNHGEPAHPYPEHVELHGDRASTEDGFGGFSPGDHAGCTCVVEPIFGGDEQ